MVDVTVAPNAGETVDLLERSAITATNIDVGDGVNNDNDLRLILPSGATANAVHTVTVMILRPVTRAQQPRAPPAPEGVMFTGVAMDIGTAPLTAAEHLLPVGTTATVCLSTAGVPGGSAVKRCTACPPEIVLWKATGFVARTIPGFVCGTIPDTEDLSPFAVGYYAPGHLPSNPSILAPSKSVNLNLIFPITTADGKTYYYLDNGWEMDGINARSRWG